MYDSAGVDQSLVDLQSQLYGTCAVPCTRRNNILFTAYCVPILRDQYLPLALQ